MTRTEALLQLLQQRTHCPEPPGSRRLYLNGQPCGLITDRTLPFLCALCPRLHPHVVVGADRVDLCPEPLGRAQQNAFFDRLTQALRTAGALADTHTEQLAIVAEDTGAVLGQADRSVFRFLGMTTVCVRAVARDTAGHFVLARRRAHKRVAPGQWDTLAGGLALAGETPQQALEREIAEEAGLTTDGYRAEPPQRDRLTRALDHGWLSEICLSFPVRLRSDAAPVNCDGEVDRFGLFTAGRLLEGIENGSVMLEAALSVLRVAQSEPPAVR